VARYPLKLILLQATPEDGKSLGRVLEETAPGQFDVAAVMDGSTNGAAWDQYDVGIMIDPADGRAGLERLRQTVRAGCRLPLILLAEHEDPALDVEAILAGAADYLGRERLDGRLLSRSIRHAVDRSAVMRAIRQSEERFRALVENSHELIILAAADATILYTSRAVSLILAYGEEELIGRNGLELVHPQDQERARGFLVRALAEPGAMLDLDLRLRHRDGSWRRIEGHAVNRLSDPAVEAIVANVRDVTDRERIERELAESEARFRHMADFAPVMIWMADANMDLVYANRAALEFTGHTLAQDRGIGWLETVHPDDQAKVLEAHRNGAEIRRKFRLDYRVRRSDGAYRRVLDIGVPRFAGYGEFAGFIGSLVDMSDLEESARALWESEERYRSVISSLQEGIVMVSADGRVAGGNASAERILGLTAAEMQGRSTMDPRWGIIREDGTPFPVPELPAEITLRTGMPCSNVVMGVHRPDGTLCWISVNSQPQLSPGEDRPQGVVVSFTDITERRRLEDQFRQAQKMETAGRLAGGIAHDFNNLLTAILGFTDFLLTDLPAGDSHRGDVEEIRRAATRAANLTRQLLAFSRRQVLRPKVLDLNGVVRGTEKMLRRLIGEDINLTPRLAEDLGRVRADAGQIEQVIVNLAVNARDAMPRGGDLVIQTADEVVNEVGPGTPGLAPGSYVTLIVSDTGVGMSAETQAHLFEPFFTTKEPGKGTGLGLATVYGIVKQSGGYIYAASEVGRGASFKILLPSVEEPMEAPELSAPVPVTARGQETILLVEDEESVRRLARKVLETAGYLVLEAPHGGEALQLAMNYRGPIHALVSDVVMPGLSGQELSTRLQMNRPGLKVLFISGYAQEAIASHGILGPGAAFLEKPFTPVALTQKVRELLGAATAT
jgi:PAS domain S-box-containing protein